ncbi:iron chelate uptake ABC transporter family permease subunit (plasmid) [Bartonella sp. HY329]|uniref:FecCD family ABC transporter permease n=1 Tax=unclassified Bartonella TaxID=2645622 RepID=UPI0021C57776|nr:MULTISPECIES: iron chelate uptake ABC transporter family permease subunit [unclassified Bartonella]UXM96667.1 iron chelate uptake ABC transporter family permease subunit [Bartonella sp. HY329]UXN10990.1 iron chelate uptake ABC transporter family permease subunit [Bartonella sp. HY328]
MRTGSWSLVIYKRNFFACLILTIFLLLISLSHLKSGSYSLNYSQIWHSIINFGENETVDRIVWRLRMPRIITAIFVGGALGVAGAVFQSLSRNPLGSPDILGFTTGAATGAILQIILINAGPWQTILAAIACGLTTSLIIFLLAYRRQQPLSITRLILIGIGVGAILSGINTILLVMGDLDQAASAQLWLSGSLNIRTLQHALLIASVFLIIMPVVFSVAKKLSLMELGDDLAKQLGVNLKRTRLIAIIAAIILTASATAVAGPIAFVALAAPQLAKRIIQSPNLVLLASALMGAILVAGADLLTLRLALNFKLPIGLVTGLLGATYLIWLLKYQSR